MLCLDLFTVQRNFLLVGRSAVYVALLLVDVVVLASFPKSQPDQSRGLFCSTLYGWCSTVYGISAKTGITVLANTTAMTNATLTNKMIHLIEGPPISLVGQERKRGPSATTCGRRWARAQRVHGDISARGDKWGIAPKVKS